MATTINMAGYTGKCQAESPVQRKHYCKAPGEFLITMDSRSKLPATVLLCFSHACALLGEQRAISVRTGPPVGGPPIAG